MIRRRLLRLFGLLPRPLRRFVVRRFTPTWTAGAVAIVERADGRWLMVSPVYRAGWTLPGGLLDRGEDPSSAVRREFAEELALEIEIIDGPWIVYDSAMRRVDAVFRAALPESVDPDSVRVHTHELDDVGWFDPTDLPETEEEADDVMELARQVAAGGSAVRWR